VALYDIVSMRRFVGIDLGREGASDETTVCKFRHLLEKHKLGQQIFAAMNAHLRKSGVKISTGTIVDATIISAPSSTKNAEGERDPEMHQTKKGNQWHFGMKAHIGLDGRTRTIHSIIATAATCTTARCWALCFTARSDVCTVTRRIEGRETSFAIMPSMRATSPTSALTRNRPLTDGDRETNRRKSSVRSYVEHAFGIIKGRFGFQKVRYRGIAKNLSRLHILAALTNLIICKKRLLQLAAA